MSSLSYAPYGRILDYWYEKLYANTYRNRFLLTKFIEIVAFRRYHRRHKNKICHYIDFPASIINDIIENPIVSIVVPVYIRNKKDASDIEMLLQSIEQQNIKPNYIIVVDDCSPFFYSFPKHLQVYRQDKNYGPAISRNLGKKIALENKSDIIAFTDADCILSKNWIEIIIKSFQHIKDFNIISGNTISYDKNWFGIYHNINGTLNGRKFKNSDRLLYGTTANLAITKKVAECINFNEKFPLAAGEDIEFCFRANCAGFAIKFIPQLAVLHNYGYTNNLYKNIKLFCSQFKKYGHGEVMLLNEIPDYYAYFDKTEEITLE